MSCQKVNPTTTNGTITFRAQCFSNFNYIPSHTYRVSLEGDSSLGPTWFHAVVTDLQNNQIFTTGSINMGSQRLASFGTRSVATVGD